MKSHARAIFAAAAMFVATLPLRASAQTVVNIDARIYGDALSGFPTMNIPFAAGSYRFFEVDPSTPDAVYTAWSPYSDYPDWLSELRIFTEVDGKPNWIAELGSYTPYTTPDGAFMSPLNVFVDLTLTEPTILEFGVGDNILHDNRGGVSVAWKEQPIVATAPEPTTLALLLPAVLGLGAYRWRSISRTRHPSRGKAVSHRAIPRC